MTRSTPLALLAKVSPSCFFSARHLLSLLLTRSKLSPQLKLFPQLKEATQGKALTSSKLGTGSKLKTRTSLIALALSLSACSTLSPNTSENEAGQQANSKGSAAQTETVKEDIEFADFDLEHDTLYDLLVAEVAAQRNQINVTLLNYIQQARHTRDPEVIKRAINAAQFAKDPVAIVELGLLWVEVEPDSAAAHQLLAYQYSLAREYGDAITHIDRVIELGGRVSVESLAIGSQTLPDPDKLKLLELYEKLEQKHPESLPVRYSLAIILANLKRSDEALAKLDSVIATDPNFEVAYVLKANLLYEQKKTEAALAFTEKGYSKFPKNNALGRLYASLLIDAKRLDDAEEVFSELSQSHPNVPAFKLSLALVKLENQKIEESSKLLTELIQAKTLANEAHYYLGRIHDSEKDIDTAVDHYLSIQAGQHKAPSRERALYLLMQDGRFDEALKILEQQRKSSPSEAQKLWALQYKLLNNFEQDELTLDTLNQAIDAYPTSQELLYTRAMWLDSKNRIEDMEADLRTILALDPNNAIALNALGYTLADKTTRYQEAFELISKALEIKPDNAAILDSMGWVLFKLDEPEKSLIFLLKAFQKFSDGEIGAHLGEVLLSLNQKTEAYEVWQKSLEINPEHPLLIKTLERLAPELLEESPSQEEGSKIEGEAKPAESTTPDSEPVQ